MPNIRHCVKGCINFQSAYRFARSGPRRQLWLKLLNVEDPKTVFIYACEHHFSDDMYRAARPMKNAIPDQNLLNCPCRDSNKPVKVNKRRSRNDTKSPAKPLEFQKLTIFGGKSQSKTQEPAEPFPPNLIEKLLEEDMSVDEDDEMSKSSEVSLTCSTKLPEEQDFDSDKNDEDLEKLPPITKTVTATSEEVLITNSKESMKKVQKKLVVNPSKSDDLETQLKATLMVGKPERRIRGRGRQPTKTPLFTGSYAKLITNPSVTWDDGTEYPKLPVRKPTTNGQEIANNTTQNRAPATPTSKSTPKLTTRTPNKTPVSEDTEFNMENYVKFPTRDKKKQEKRKLDTSPDPIYKTSIVKNPIRYSSVGTNIRKTKKWIKFKNNRKRSLLTSSTELEKSGNLVHDHSYSVDKNADTEGSNDGYMITKFVAIKDKSTQTPKYTIEDNVENEQLFDIIARLNKKIVDKGVEIKLNVIKQHVLKKELDHITQQYSLLENEMRRKQQIINNYKLLEEKYNAIKDAQVHEYENSEMNKMSNGELDDNIYIIMEKDLECINFEDHANDLDSTENIGNELNHLSDSNNLENELSHINSNSSNFGTQHNDLNSSNKLGTESNELNSNSNLSIKADTKSDSHIYSKTEKIPTHRKSF